MTKVVVDTSAVLALMLDEPGADLVDAKVRTSYITAVNFAEIVSYYAKLGATDQEVADLVEPLPCAIVPVDRDLSLEAGMLRLLTLPGGLSLGDRYCLALARRMNLPVLTAERRWPPLAEAVGVEIVLIR